MTGAISSRGLGYDDRGRGSVLVFVHGHPFDRTMWQPQLDGLDSEFRVLALDLPGYGTSPTRTDPMPMPAFADAVLELLDERGIETAVVIGLSMGGLVAMELGLRCPDRVRGLVLAATTAEPVADGEREQREARAAVALEQGMLPLATDMIGRLFGPAAARDRPLVVRIFAMMLATKPEGAAAALRGRARRPDYGAALGSLRVPALVIAGGHDEFSPRPVIEHLIAALPDPELVTFAESGHLPNLEEPQRFNAVIGEFARRLPE